MSHQSTEFEVVLNNGEIRVDGCEVLNDLQKAQEVLQFDVRIAELFDIIGKKIKCSPALGICTKELFYSIKDDIIECFQKSVLEFQQLSLKDRKMKDNELLAAKCSGKSLIHNFTNKSIPEELVKVLEVGLSTVPRIIFPTKALMFELEAEAKLACKKMFYSEVGYYPVLSSKSSLGEAVLEIISQSPSNSYLVSQLIDFKNQFLENIQFFLSSISESNCVHAKDLVFMIPDDCIISPSDKNVGVSLLPSSWYSKQYHEQIAKGGHELQIMDEPQCLAMLLRKISNFKKSCSATENKILVKWWPRNTVKEPRIGVMKLVPKVHKLTGPITVNSWEELKSRPIRGAEKDPMKDPSKALYGMLHSMLDDLKKFFPSLFNDQVEKFSVLKGCDDY